MHMPGSVTGTTKWVARILPEGCTDESAMNWQAREAPGMRKHDSPAARTAGRSTTWSAPTVRTGRPVRAGLQCVGCLYL